MRLSGSGFGRSDRVGKTPLIGPTADLRPQPSARARLPRSPLATRRTAACQKKEDLRSKLGRTPFPLAKKPEKQPGQVTRLLRRLHAHGLIAKVPRSRRWRVSLGGRRLMPSAIKLREVAFPKLVGSRTT